ncbi:MAG: transcriptional regulator GcvA [Proteobacteria bacterium]|nr:transcriptional regulator GcvA [Pseudomonadota bacterium]
MAWRLPPMNALRALEAAGRHVSFTRAAEELHVTPGAISRQIRGLEDHLGVPLFERNHREVKLTKTSRAYVGTLTVVFERIDRATRSILDSKRERHLHIHSSITFTLRWLLPKLGSFHARHPKQEIRLTTALPIAANFATGDTDVAIRLAGASPDMIAHRLVDIELMPVCSPKLFSDIARVRAPAELRTHTLLHSSARPHDWANWLSAAGAPSVDPQRGIRFESSSLAYQAAIEGIGVAVGVKALVAEDLSAGRLVAPFDFIYRDGSAFHLVYSRHAAQNPQLIEFRDWIIAEAGCDGTVVEEGSPGAGAQATAESA